MRRAADAKPCVAPLLPETHAERPLSLIRARRMGELFLLWNLALAVLLEWRARLDPIAAIELVLDVGGEAISGSERAALGDALTEHLAEPEPPQTIAILDAAGRWFCRLELPDNEAELLDGRPLLLRLRDV